MALRVFSCSFLALFLSKFFQLKPRKMLAHLLAKQVADLLPGLQLLLLFIFFFLFPLVVMPFDSEIHAGAKDSDLEQNKDNRNPIHFCALQIWLATAWLQDTFAKKQLQLPSDACKLEAKSCLNLNRLLHATPTFVPMPSACARPQSCRFIM